ncbi:MAG: shikimate kinase [Rikenellaceae bacterium]
MLIFLIGYMGCGKSTIGRKLKQRLGWPLVDTDALIEESERRTIGEIFETNGEEYFRECERATVRSLIYKGDSCIVSTGGGLPIWQGNMELLKAAGLTVYILRTAENIASRLSPNGRYKRPKLRGLNDEELISFMSNGIAERDPIYREAELVIEAVPMSDDEILNTIINYIKGLK